MSAEPTFAMLVKS